MGIEHPAEGPAGQHLPEVVAGGHKAHVGPGEEEHKAHVCIGQAHRDAAQRAGIQFERCQLEDAEHQDDGQQGGGDLVQVGGQALMEELPQLHRVLHLGHNGVKIGAVAGLERDAQDQHGQDGADGAQGHQTEAVVRRVAVASGWRLRPRPAP